MPPSTLKVMLLINPVTWYSSPSNRSSRLKIIKAYQTTQLFARQQSSLILLTKYCRLVV
jgi:hypothetical protein